VKPAYAGAHLRSMEWGESALKPIGFGADVRSA
jgi:hypothetical protein